MAATPVKTIIPWTRQKLVHGINLSLTKRLPRERAIRISKEIHGEKRKEWNVYGWPADAGDHKAVNSIYALYDYLVDYGPLYVFYSRKPEGGHCVIVTGVDVENGIVYTNNPWGVRGKQSFFDFLNGVARRWYDPAYDYQLFAVYPRSEEK